MSVSKLESLPNEILTVILEKYINGIDVLNAFAFQLNRRFDALIAGCYRLRFDFIRCHKYEFRLCMGLLSGYIDQVEELALSEEHTPGQIYAFLHFFSSFTLFKQLCKLNFHVSVGTTQPGVVEMALRSLMDTNLHTLCIKITEEKNISSLNPIIVEIFRMKTLRKLSITCDSYKMNWSPLNEISSNIEYLTMNGIPCQFQDLKKIFQCASGLKYLDVQIENVVRNNYPKSKSSSENIIPRMPMLRTVLFRMNEKLSEVADTLGSYLRCMPSLHRLEFIMSTEVDDFSILETLLKTSAPTLSYFNLESRVYAAQHKDTKTILESIQTPFWVDKTNFNIVIKEFVYMAGDQFEIFARNSNLDGSKQSVRQWWIGPKRKLRDNISANNKITSLNLSSDSSSLLQDDYLDNVNHLEIEEFNDNLLELITTHVNCSRIRHLDVTRLRKNLDKISSFLPYVRNISSIRIKFNQLINDRFAYLKECNNLKLIDISANQHSFDEKHILIIGNMFPNTEHLIINTVDLRNVPILQLHLPHLHSLSFVDIEPVDESPYDRYSEQRADYNLRQKAKFLFLRKSNLITIWADEDALQDPYWNNVGSQQSIYDDSWFK